MGGSRTPETFKPLLLKIVSQPEQFTADDIKESIEHLATPDAVSPAQIGAFLTALKLSGREHSYETVCACAQVMMAHAVPVSVESPDEYYVDIVGTGGDGHNTFNISTAAAIVAAGAGARVIKVWSLSLASYPIILIETCSMAIVHPPRPRDPPTSFARWDVHCLSRPHLPFPQYLLHSCWLHTIILPWLG
jgi:anthranilate phosphoribosyltransferase